VQPVIHAHGAHRGLCCRNRHAEAIRDFPLLNVIDTVTLVASVVGIAAFPASSLWALFVLSLLLIAARYGRLASPRHVVMHYDVSPIIEESDVPSASVLDRRLIESAYFRDSYRAPLSRPHSSVIDIFHGIFAHQPMYMKIVLIVRNRIVSCFGLDAPTASAILSPRFKSSYAVGDKIGVWPIFALTETELVAGRDNKHLDFRLSVLKVTDGEAGALSYRRFARSTMCSENSICSSLPRFINGV
jgi:hypothetical protein